MRKDVYQMMKYIKVTEEIVTELEKIVGTRNVLTDMDTMAKNLLATQSDQWGINQQILVGPAEDRVEH